MFSNQQQPSCGQRTNLLDNLHKEQIEQIMSLKSENSNLKMQLKNLSNAPKVNQYTNPSKNSTSCPFLIRRGWCVKGNKLFL